MVNHPSTSLIYNYKYTAAFLPERVSVCLLSLGECVTSLSLKRLTTLCSSARGNTGYVELIINFHIDFSIIYLYSYFSFLSRTHHACFAFTFSRLTTFIQCTQRKTWGGVGSDRAEMTITEKKKKPKRTAVVFVIHWQLDRLGSQPVTMVVFRGGSGHVIKGAAPEALSSLVLF